MIKSIRYAVLAAFVFAPVVGAADLRPDQKEALEKVMAAIDPSMREMVRPQMEQTVSMMNPEQLKLFVASASKGASNTQEAPAEEEPERQASPEDLAHNRAQYEPAMRKHWAAKKAFDEFVDAEMQAKCPNPDKYAVYREAERYELMSLSPNWQRASTNADNEVQIVGATYAPKDGRYEFDFTNVRMTFDKGSVSSAIAKACADWTNEAAAFKQKAAALMSSGQSEAAHRFQGTASAKVNQINQALEAVLNAEGPAGNYNAAMMDALQNPKRIK